MAEQDGYTGTTEMECQDENGDAARLTIITSVMDSPETLIQVTAIGETLMIGLTREQLEIAYQALAAARHYWDN